MYAPPATPETDALLVAINKLLNAHGELKTISNTRIKTETRLTAQFGVLTLRRDRAVYREDWSHPRDTLMVYAPGREARTKKSTVFRQRLGNIEICRPGDWQAAVLGGMVPVEEKTTEAKAPARRVNSVFALGGS
jgi:hypothetical protein